MTVSEKPRRSAGGWFRPGVRVAGVRRRERFCGRGRVRHGAGVPASHPQFIMRPVRRSRPLRFVPCVPRPTAAALSLAAAAVWGAGGCEPAPEPAFPEPDGYAGMFEPLRTGTRAEVEDLDTGELAERDLPGFDAALAARFGTPAEPVVFTRLPVRFGAGTAVVADAVPGEPSRRRGRPPTARRPSRWNRPTRTATSRTLPEGETFHWTDYDGLPPDRAGRRGPIPRPGRCRSRASPRTTCRPPATGRRSAGRTCCSAGGRRTSRTAFTVTGPPGRGTGRRRNTCSRPRGTTCRASTSSPRPATARPAGRT